MAALDRKARNTAKRLIDKFGKVAIYQARAVEPVQVYNEETGLFESSAGFRTYQIKIAPPVTPAQDELVDGQILTTDLKFEIAALGAEFTPQANDRITFDDRDYTVKMVKTQYSGELIAYWLVFAGN